MRFDVSEGKIKKGCFWSRHQERGMCSQEPNHAVFSKEKFSECGDDDVVYMLLCSNPSVCLPFLGEKVAHVHSLLSK